MKYNRLWSITSLCILAALASGCEKESQVYDETCMSVLVSDISSKATITTDQSFESLYGTSGFLAYSCGHDDPSLVAVDFRPFVKRTESTIWEPISKITWPGYATDFFAWAPNDEENIVFSTKDHTIYYITPTDVNSQHDLLVAENTNIPAWNNAPIVLSFGHALTAVKLITGEDFPEGSVIKSVSICNVNLNGKYQFAPTDGTARWKALSCIGRITLDLSESTDVVPADNDGMPITKDNQTFFVIPQACPDNVHLEILYGEKIKKIYMPDGFAFRQGECVTLEVSGRDGWFYATVVKVEQREDVDAGTMSI